MYARSDRRDLSASIRPGWLTLEMHWLRRMKTGRTRRASLLGSAEYFSRFTNTTFDDEAAAAVTVNWGDGASQVTHDKELENWANVSRFDRGYLSPGLVDVMVSSILHEDNEFSIPRKAGAAIMAEWTSTRD